MRMAYDSHLMLQACSQRDPIHISICHLNDSPLSYRMQLMCYRILTWRTASKCILPPRKLNDFGGTVHMAWGCEICI